MSAAQRRDNAEAMAARLIFRVSPRIDARAIARRMAECHRALAPILESSEADLCQAYGLNGRTAAVFSALPQLARYIATEEALAQPDGLADFAACGRYFAARCVALHHERMMMLCLDREGRLLHASTVTDGTLDEAPFYMRMIIERALDCGARYLVLCHNHPGGAPFASMNDAHATVSLLGVCAPLRLILLDHIIIADSTPVSIRRDTLGDELFRDQLRGDKLLTRWFGR